MPNVVTQTALITPSSGTSTGALADYMMAAFRENNGTVSVGVDLVSGDEVTVNIGTLTTGTVNVATVTAGSIRVTVGTVNTGTVNVATVTAGTINTGTLNAGTVDLLKAGTITELGTATGIGTLTNVGSVGAIGTIPGVGSISGIGTVPGVGTLTNLGSVTNVGSIYGVGGTVIVDIAGTEPIVVEVGTIAAGTLNRVGNVGTLEVGTISALPNVTLAGGTVQNLVSGTINSATATVNMATGTLNVATISTLPNVPGGSIVVTVGTVVAGTLTNLISGTINSATVTGNLGTLSMLSAGTLSMLSAGTLTKLLGGTIDTVNGTAKVDLATLISGEDQTNDVLKVEGQFNGTYYQAVGTTNLKGTATGLLHSVNVGLPVASDVITLYDSQNGTSGTLLGKITIGTAPESLTPFSQIYDQKFVNGLVYSQTGTSNISISWR